MLDPVISGVAQASLALVFLAAALHKLRDLPGFADTVREYRLIPGALVAPASYAIPAIELLAAAGILIDATRAYAALTLLALLLAFTFGIVVNLLRGRRDIDCGCWGPAVRQPLSEWLVARNAILFALAGLCLFPAGAREIHWIDFMTVGAATVALLFVFVSGNHLIANAPRLVNLRRPHD